MMPGMAGDALCRRLRADPRFAALKIVLVSSMQMPAAILQEQPPLFDQILVKPLRSRALVDNLARLCEAPAPRPIIAAKPSCEAAPASGRVLLAEDNPVNRQVAVAMLGRSGYQIDEVVDGAEAVAAIEARAYDLVLMDVQMPVMDGVEATRRIRALPGARSGVPIIALTAHAMSGAREQYIAAGMNDYLSKPFTRVQLLELVGKWIGQTAAEPSEPLAEEAAAGPEPILDEAILQDLVGGEAESFVANLVGSYLASSAELLSAIERGIETRDLPALRRAAHDLVSTGGSFGARRLQLQAERMGAAGRAGDVAAALTLARELVPIARQTETALKVRFLAEAL
jgi:CheY-like chemotaxis protein